jgi:hypothetical protein
MLPSGATNNGSFGLAPFPPVAANASKINTAGGTTLASGGVQSARAASVARTNVMIIPRAI